jgi:hypothetical protein
MMNNAQIRYVRLYREIHGVDLLGGRWARRPWLFFVEFLGMMRTVFRAYDSAQSDPELERRRLAARRWKWITFTAFALLFALAVARLAGVA